MGRAWHWVLEQASFRVCRDDVCQEPAMLGYHSHHMTWFGRMRFTGRRVLRWL